MHVNITWMTLIVHSIKNLLGELWEITVYEVTTILSLDLKSTKTEFRTEQNRTSLKKPQTLWPYLHTLHARVGQKGNDVNCIQICRRSVLLLRLFMFLLNTNPALSRALFIILFRVKAITNTFVAILYNIRGTVHLGYFGQTFQWWHTLQKDCKWKTLFSTEQLLQLLTNTCKLQHKYSTKQYQLQHNSYTCTQAETINPKAQVWWD